MASTGKNTRSTSTTYRWKRVRISGGAPEGPAPQASSKRWHSLKRRDPGGPLTVTIVHRGGAESWWLVKARGRSGVFPGHRALDDVMAEVNQTW